MQINKNLRKNCLLLGYVPIRGRYDIQDFK